MEMKLFTTLILTLLFSTTLFDPALSELCNQNDKKALLQIKKAFNNPYVLTSWHEDTDCCDWYCVKCHPKTHRITSLFVPGGLSGTIPPQIGDLPYLDNLDLHKQINLTGPIPPSITKLRNLQSLRLDGTSISGSVPGFLSQLTNLNYLDLSFNKLTGPIPASLSKLPNLGHLRLDRNRLTGPIPDSFGEFKVKRFYLELSHNQLSGKIPAALGRKKDFAHIDLSWNKLQGDVNSILGSDKMVSHVDLSRNLLEFDMSKVVVPKSLTWLDLNHNKITGSLPLGLAAMGDLQYLNVSYNRLCGRIPVGGKLQKLEATSYVHNLCLCGAPLQRCK